MVKSMKHCLHICISCREKTHDDADIRPGRLLYDRLINEYQDKDNSIKPVKCLVQCDNPCAVSLSHADKFSYLLSGLNADTDMKDLLTFFGQYQQTEDGIVPFATRPKNLRAKIKGRIPPLNYHESLD
ncbi:MAG: DUF1636 domain-containing protein [Alphaproteobacteria bacterium]|nr:DUF1636 domain-containing protein [Alphaproteobacteria bacterium]